MARPRYQVKAADWLDILDWLDYQLSQPHWLEEPEHPIHEFGLAVLQDSVGQWRDISKPTKEVCDSAQQVLNNALSTDDWGRLRKTLSARKRRRKDKRVDTKLVNITLTASAHKILSEYRQLSSCQTLSDAIELGLQSAFTELQAKQEKQLTEALLIRLKGLKASEFVSLVDDYLVLSAPKRSWANSCKVALQLFKSQPDRDKLRLVRTRFVEDLVWNQMHLKVSFEQLPIFLQQDVQPL